YVAAGQLATPTHTSSRHVRRFYCYNTVMAASYDIIVIGAGLGGLCAAFEASRSGKRVLLIEQHNLPGGYATSFVRGRFEFEPSLHEMPDVRSIEEATGVVRYLTDDAGLDIDFVSVPEAYRIILTEKGTNVRMPFGQSQCIDLIEKEVPGSRNSVTAYLDLCGEVQAAFRALSGGDGRLDYGKIFREHGNFLRTGAYTAENVADALNLPKKARDLLYPYWCYLGVPMNRVSFPMWASLLNAYLSAGAVIPKLRSHGISAAFIRGIEDHGGEIRYNTRVEQVLVEDGRVQGVLTSFGERISCRAVISNASPTLMFNFLIQPSSAIPAAAKKMVNARKHGFSLVVVYLGLDADRHALGLEDYSYFIAPHMDTERLYEGIYSLESDEIMQASICLNAANPSCSPEGTTILALTAGYRSEAWVDVRPEDYFRMKTRAADRLIRQFERATGTDIRSHIEEIEVATPQTFARYTGAYDGIVYGYEPEPWDSVVPRALSRKKETFVRGLYFCGGFSYRCHGYGSSILSGKDAGETAVKDLGSGVTA
ncbi:MAG: NAD(P)/FAD-dependent oxidoreductase, partial [Spirochaetaceae bacterium]|nr:NAD(P)/FAD-dependent oxidoreductase [Spirochaetaceae bacterium]